MKVSRGNLGLAGFEGLGLQIHASKRVILHKSIYPKVHITQSYPRYFDQRRALIENSLLQNKFTLLSESNLCCVHTMPEHFENGEKFDG